jgi:hypothetical protein
MLCTCHSSIIWFLSRVTSHLHTTELKKCCIPVEANVNHKTIQMFTYAPVNFALNVLDLHDICLNTYKGMITRSADYSLDIYNVTCRGEAFMLPVLAMF